jgi:hypothetical protein
MIISLSIPLGMKYSREVCTENQHTYLMATKFFENRDVYEIMRKNIVKPDRSQMTI